MNTLPEVLKSFMPPVITVEQMLALMPHFALLVTALAALLLGTVTQKDATGRVSHDLGQRLAYWASLVGLVTTLVFLVLFTGYTVDFSNGILVVDSFSRFFAFVVVLCAFFVCLSSSSYNRREQIVSEFYAMVCLSTLGMILLASTYDLVFMFVSIEIMSLATYVLVAMRRSVRMSAEAGVKYFILGGFASAVFLFGATYLFGASGSLNAREIYEVMASPSGPPAGTLYMVGLLLVFVGFLFKVGSFPFQMWVPDVYQGASTTVTGFMTSAVKAVAFAAFIRIVMKLAFIDTPVVSEFFHHVLWICAVLTMFFGNIVALVQTNIKRMLAYSTIAHTGYLLVGLVAAQKTQAGYEAVMAYLFFYAIMNLGAFAVIAQFSKVSDKNLELADMSGLGFKSPVLGAAFALFLFAMAGIPPTSGFVGKYYLFSAAVKAGEVPLVILGVIASAISAYYYLRVLVYLYMRESDGVPVPSIWRGAFVTSIVTALFTLQMGIFPATLMGSLKYVLPTF